MGIILEQLHIVRQELGQVGVTHGPDEDHVLIQVGVGALEPARHDEHRCGNLLEVDLQSDHEQEEDQSQFEDDVDGFLVDHEPPIRINTELSSEGIGWAAGEERLADG